MSKLCSFLPKHTLLSVYNTLNLSYLNYCNIVWAHSSTSKLHSLLIQKRAIHTHSIALFTREPKTNVPCCGRQLSVTKVVCDFMTNIHMIAHIVFPTSLVYVRSHCVLFISSLVLCQCPVKCHVFALGYHRSFSMCFSGIRIFRIFHRVSEFSVNLNKKLGDERMGLRPHHTVTPSLIACIKRRSECFSIGFIPC